MSTKTNPHLIRQREAHHEALKAMAPKNSNRTGLEMWRRLRRIEAKGAAFALQLCNGPELSEAEQDAITEQIKLAVAREFGGQLPKGFFLNRDPRGYALKLEPDSVPLALHRDFGGYQILAPEIN